MTKKSLASLRPLDDAQDIFKASPAYVWGTIFIVWMACLLPWRNWDGAPDILLLILAFWCSYSVRNVGIVTAFFFGILMDVHDTNILGMHALYYVLVIYAVIKLRNRMSNFNVFAHFLYLFPVFVLAQIPGRVFEAWMEGAWSGWGWMWSGAFTALLWFAADLILKLPIRPIEDKNVID